MAPKRRTHESDGTPHKVARPAATTTLNSQDDYKHLYKSAVPLDVYVWGTGSMCELGVGPLAKNKEIKRPRLNSYLTHEQKIVSIAVGGMHTLVLDSDDNIWTWGCNDSGALGRDTSQAAEQLKDMDAAGSDEDEDDDGDLNELESTPTKLDRELFPPLAAGHHVAQLAATDNLSAVLFSSGEVYAWGTFRCNEGVLGFYRDEIKMQRTPWRVPAFSRAKVVQIAAGKDHLVFLDAHGRVYTWGNGQQYQLGRKVLDRYRLKTLDPRPMGLRRVRAVFSGENHSFALTEKKGLLAWGLNQYGQCGVSPAIADGALVAAPQRVLLDGAVKMVAAGEHHSLFLLHDGSLLSCGRLDMHEVGIRPLPDSVYRDEHGRPRAVPTPEPVTNAQDSLLEPQPLPALAYLACGSHHSVAIAADSGALYTWGFGDTYALGQGPAGEDLPVPTLVSNTATRDQRMVQCCAGGQFSVAGGHSKV